MQVPLNLMNRMTLTKLHASTVLALGPTFDQLKSLDSGQGPNRMHLINLKSWPWAPTFDSLDPLDSDQGPTRMHLINLKVLASGGGTFDSLGPLDSGQGPHRMNLNESKVLALRPTL